MDFSKLFRVLVIGGSVIGCGDSSRSRALSSNDSGAGGQPAETEAPDATAAEGGDDSAERGDDAARRGDDAARRGDDAVAAADAQAATDSGLPDVAGERAPGQLCFCNTTPRCCEAHEGSPATVAPGFECCWGTTC